ncbi:MAG: energy transducer TonB [Acidobacteriia bacterium]|nr:energy transducer TonB [Terriglobia bacterium]
MMAHFRDLLPNRLSIAIVLFILAAVASAWTQDCEIQSCLPDKDDGGVYHVGGGVSAPRVVYASSPEYSKEARKAKLQGTVVLWVVVGKDGRVRNIRVAQTLGMGLDEKAIEAVSKWRFVPGHKDGKPVPVQINVEVAFRLE